MPKMQCTILKSLLTCSENFTLEFSHTHTLSNRIMLPYACALGVLGAVSTCTVNSDTCRSSSGAEYYKGFLIIIEVASFILLSNPLLRHSENYAICHCN